MSDTAIFIFAVAVGGLFALVGAYIGYRAGRRQTSDQATVEHGQWLRGQRQHAYLAFVGTWDRWVESLQGVRRSWELRVHEYQQDHALESPG